MTGATGPAPTRATGATGKAGGATGPTGPIDKRLESKFKVPEKYVNEAWAKEVKNTDDLWSKMAGAQKLIGKDRIPVPGENATPEELNEFYTKIGRPETPDGYEFQSLEELKEVERNKTLDAGIKKIFHEEGISKKAGERIVSKYEALIYDMQKPTIEQAAKQDIEFQKLASEVLGEDKDTAIENFKSVMKETLGDKAFLASKIETMSNEELMPLIVFGKNMHDKYTGENRVENHPNGMGNLTGDLKSDFQTLSQEKLRVKTDDKMPKHIQKIKLANLNTQMAKIGTKAKEQGIDLFAS